MLIMSMRIAPPTAKVRPIGSVNERKKIKELNPDSSNYQELTMVAATQVMPGHQLRNIAFHRKIH